MKTLYYKIGVYRGIIIFLILTGFYSNIKKKKKSFENMFLCSGYCIGMLMSYHTSLEFIINHQHSLWYPLCEEQILKMYANICITVAAWVYPEGGEQVVQFPLDFPKYCFFAIVNFLVPPLV